MRQFKLANQIYEVLVTKFFSIKTILNFEWETANLNRFLVCESIRKDQNNESI